MRPATAATKGARQFTTATKPVGCAPAPDALLFLRERVRVAELDDGSPWEWRPVLFFGPLGGPLPVADGLRRRVGLFLVVIFIPPLWTVTRHLRTVFGHHAHTTECTEVHDASQLP